MVKHSEKRGRRKIPPHFRLDNPIQVMVSDGTFTSLVALADVDGLPMSTLVRMVLLKYIRDHEGDL